MIIQVASHFGSRRQEAQRLGRVLRPKPGDIGNSEFNAYFYTLVSEGTRDMYFANKRQQYLINQGYRYEVIPMKRLIDRIQVDEVSQKSQQDILEAVLNTAEGEDDIDHLDDDEILSQPDEEESDDEYVPPAEGHRSTFRPIRNISGRGTDMLSGGAGLAYAEGTS